MDSCPEYHSQIKRDSFDLDQDGSFDIQFILDCHNEHGIYQAQLAISFLLGGECILLPNTIDPAVLSANQTISSFTDWGGNSASMLRYQHNYSQGSSWLITGVWENVTDGYLGFRLPTASGFHHGWILMDVINIGHGFEVVIKEYASECNPSTVETIPETEIGSGLTVFPNPGTGEFSIHWPEGKTQRQSSILSVIDAQGKVIKKEVIAKNIQEIKLDLGDISNGLYQISLKNAQGAYSTNIILQR